MKITNIKLVVITAFAISLLLMGCNEEVYDGAYKPSLESHYLSVYPRDFEFGNGEETKTGSITSENAWSFTSVPSWLSLTPSNGNSDADFSIASKANESVSNREAVFYVSTNSTTSKIQRTLTASQTGSSPYITFPEYGTSTITIEGKSDYMIIDVNSNIPDLTATFSQSWASATYNSEAKTVNVEIQANETNTSRSGTLTVSSSQYSRSAKLTISQLASGVTVLEGIAMSYDADGGSQTRTIKSDLPWTAQTTYSWIEFSPKSGNAGETTMTITTLPSFESDKRIGQVYFYFGDTEKQYIGITQEGRYLTVTPEEITLPSDGECSETICVDSNIDWEISSCPDWIIASKNNGNAGKTNITINVQKNNSLNSRSATVKIKDSMTGGIATSFKVVQEGFDFGNETSLEFDWHASKQLIVLPFPNSWSASVSSGWISLSNYTGVGGDSVEVSVTTNNNEDLRTGSIIFTSENHTYNVNIVQGGQYITISSSNSEISALGGILEISVSSSITMESSVEYESQSHDWIEIKNDDDTYVLCVDYNPSSNERAASFVVKGLESEILDSYSRGIKFPIKQYGRKLGCTVSNISMFSSGGTSNICEILADGQYVISKPDDDIWYTIVNESPTTFYIVASENNTDVQRNSVITISLLNLPSDESKEIQIPLKQFSKSESEIIVDGYDPDIKI